MKVYAREKRDKEGEGKKGEEKDTPSNSLLHHSIPFYKQTDSCKNVQYNHINPK